MSAIQPGSATKGGPVQGTPEHGGVGKSVRRGLGSRGKVGGTGGKKAGTTQLAGRVCQGQDPQGCWTGWRSERLPRNWASS